MTWCFYLPNEHKTLALHSARLLQRSEDWQRLLHHRLSRMQFDDEVRDIALTCEQYTALADQPLSLLPETAHTDTSWLTLCDELRQRVGEQSIQFVKPLADPRPECSLHIGTEQPKKASKRTPHNTTLNASAQWPLLLLDKPERLVGKPPHWNNQHGWRLISGPERVEFGWWSTQPVNRDYYRAVNTEHVQAWLFQDLASNTKLPQWYIHGYFA